MNRPLEGKVALVTGGSAGIGRAIVERFIADGASVVSLSRSCAPEQQSEVLQPLSGDVRSPEANRRAVETALDRFGKLDILVANAGVYDNRREFRSFDANELDGAFDELFGVNVKGYMQAALAARPALQETQGTIIFTSSISGAHAGFGGALYVAAKHAINGLTKQLALELAPHITVNAIAPGYVPTQLRGLATLGQDKMGSAPDEQAMLLQKFGMPEDFAAAYSFLASDACRHIATGTILTLDGGSTLRGPGTARIASDA